METSPTTTNSSRRTTLGATTRNTTFWAAWIRSIGAANGCSRLASGRARSPTAIRRGARWSGLDLTQESVDRVQARLEIRGLPYDDLRRGSALDIPYDTDSFDLVFSHGVLHHVPDIAAAQAEIRRVLRPDGMLIAMLYARHSLNYQVSIKVVRRLALLGAHVLRRVGIRPRSLMLEQHLANADAAGLRHYLSIDTFTHRNTDGPLNPYARVYSTREAAEDFRDFELVQSHSRYMHAPPLPVHGLPGERWLGWHLWVHLRPRPVAGPAAPSPEPP